MDQMLVYVAQHVYKQIHTFLEGEACPWHREDKQSQQGCDLLTRNDGNGGACGGQVCPEIGDTSHTHARPS